MLDNIIFPTVSRDVSLRQKYDYATVLQEVVHKLPIIY